MHSTLVLLLCLTPAFSLSLTPLKFNAETSDANAAASAAEQYEELAEKYAVSDANMAVEALINWFTESPGASIGLMLFCVFIGLGATWHFNFRPRAAESEPLQATAPADSEDKSIGGALFYVTVWIMLSALMTMYNAWIFSKTGANFPYVIALTTWHQFLLTVMIFSIRLLFPSMMPAAVEMRQSASTVLACVAVPGIMMCGTLTLGNKSYLYLSVSLIQMVKAGMPMACYLIGCMLGMETFTKSLLAVSITIIVGVSMTITGEINVSLIGLAFMLSSFVCESFRLVTLKRMVSGHGINFDPLSSLMFFAPLAFSLLACLLFITGEVWMVPYGNLPIIHLIANGCVAMSLNVASVYLLRGTSGTTMAVCGIMKDILIILVSIPLFHTSVSCLQVLGFSITVAAIHVYNSLKKDPDCIEKTIADLAAFPKTVMLK